MCAKKKKEKKKLLEEVLISSIGLPPETTQVQIRGDSAMRDTVLVRPKKISVVDEQWSILQKKFIKLLLETGVYHLEIDFGNCEIVTRRILDPLSYEVHKAERFIEEGYIDRHFPILGYQNKSEIIRKLHSFMSEQVEFLRDEEWRDILIDRNENWDSMSPLEIRGIVSSLKCLRDIENYYLRSVKICINQKMIEMRFNCDGTAIVASSYFNQFIQENV